MKSTTLAAKSAPAGLSQKPSAPVSIAGTFLSLAKQTALTGRDILGIQDLSANEIELIIDTALVMKHNLHDPGQKHIAPGCCLAMLFEKPSLRTRVTFELGMTQLGGSAINLEGKLGIRESVSDVATNLDRWVDVIMARTFEHATIVELAQHADIPVINGLSDLEHPCQALADLLTIREHKGEFAGLTIAYVGDCNNVANSLMLGSVKLGANFVMACPPSFPPNDDIVAAAACAARVSGSNIRLMHDPVTAVTGADVVYTDTWISMGQESESAARQQIFSPYQLNDTILSYAKPDAIVMHCLPAHRGSEITNEVIDGLQSVVLDQAENRLHVQKALLALIL